MKNIFSLILIGLFCQTMFAQDFTKDIKKMHQAYIDASSFIGKMNIKVYSNNKIFTTKKATVNKQNHKFLYTIDGTTMLINQKCILMVDKTQNLMVVDKVDKETLDEKIQLSQLMFENLDTLLSFYEKWDFLGEKNGQKTYLIYLPNSKIKRVELTLDTKQYAIRQLIYHYDDEPVSENKVVIYFEKVNLKPTFAKNFFSEKKFIRKIKNKWTPSPRYENYELVLADNNQ